MKDIIEDRILKMVWEYNPDICKKSKSCKNIHYNPNINDWYPNLECYYLKYGKVYIYIPIDETVPILVGFLDINKKINILPDSLYHKEINVLIAPIIEEYNNKLLEQERLIFLQKEQNRLKNQEILNKKRLKEEQIKNEKEAKDLETINNYLDKIKL